MLSASGMIYMNVGEMCSISMEVYNELFNDVHTFRL